MNSNKRTCRDLREDKHTKVNSYGICEVEFDAVSSRYKIISARIWAQLVSIRKMNKVVNNKDHTRVSDN